MGEQGARADVEIAGVAARQHGIVTIQQLAAAGLSKDAVWKRGQAGRLHRIHRGVYAVGHKGLGNEGRWMAAVLACGEGAVLSHASAAALWELLPFRGGPSDVTVPTSSGRARRPGIRIHRSPSLPKTATTIRNRIPVTTPARTIADLDGIVPGWMHRKAIREAEFLGLDLGKTPTDHTRSELESLFLRLCRRYRLPMPEVNAKIGRFTVDFLWRDARLVVETDGYAAHRGSQAFEDDHARELELRALGYRLRRFTYSQIRAQPTAVAAEVRASLSL